MNITINTILYTSTTAEGIRLQCDSASANYLLYENTTKHDIIQQIYAYSVSCVLHVSIFGNNAQHSNFISNEARGLQQYERTPAQYMDQSYVQRHQDDDMITLT